MASSKLDGGRTLARPQSRSSGRLHPRRPHFSHSSKVARRPLQTNGHAVPDSRTRPASPCRKGGWHDRNSLQSEQSRVSPALDCHRSVPGGRVWRRSEAALGRVGAGAGAERRRGGRHCHARPARSQEYRRAKGLTRDLSLLGRAIRRRGPVENLFGRRFGRSSAGQCGKQAGPAGASLICGQRRTWPACMGPRIARGKPAPIENAARAGFAGAASK